MDRVRPKRAIISVSDKRNLSLLVGTMGTYAIEMISTGGTADTITGLGGAVTRVSDFTGSPEVMGGRVKTLDPSVFGGILFRRDDPLHWHALGWLRSHPIDIVVVNLYPFQEKVTEGKPHGEIVENIDIGGPSLIRAAAKNYQDVVVITSPKQYQLLLTQLQSFDGHTTLDFREQCAAAAFELTADYDAAINQYFARRLAGSI